MFVSILIAGKNPDETACVAGGCVTHATCDTSASPTICECDTGYTASPTSTPTMCKFTISYNKIGHRSISPLRLSFLFSHLYDDLSVISG